MLAVLSRATGRASSATVRHRDCLRSHRHPPEVPSVPPRATATASSPIASHCEWLLTTPMFSSGMSTPGAIVTYSFASLAACAAVLDERAAASPPFTDFRETAIEEAMAVKIMFLMALGRVSMTGCIGEAAGFGLLMRRMF